MRLTRLQLLLGFTLCLAVAAVHASPEKVFTLDPQTVAKSFQVFDPDVRVRWDEDYFYVESNSMPDHRMMVGIRAWNQQVPLPQPYSGGNAFQLTLRPRYAETPISGKETLFRGAIAVAANGIPIFNPIKQDGRTDTNLAGELDEFGGHAGRADDYHYHLGPVHLAERLGPDLPLAWALDGFPIYGYREPDGSPVADLDWLNGHPGADGGYHYHATEDYPYLNGGFRGEVELRDGEVAVQPRARGVRPYTRPLRGAAITAFERPDDTTYQLECKLGGEYYSVEYSVERNGGAGFVFTDPGSPPRTERYSARDRRGGGKKGGSKRAEGRRDEQRTRGGRKGPDPNDPNRRPWLVVHAPELDANGDGDLAYAELMADIETTFQSYDQDDSGRVTQEEYSVRGVRTAFGGYAQQHSDEIDSDGDGALSKQEMVSVAERMFRRADRNSDQTVDRAELRER